jgi:predicted Zn-dependent peptidase
VVATLDNGLTVWMSADRDEPRVFASVVVRAGAAEDPAETTGVAHYLEHMLANKGTRRLGTLDHAAEAPHLAEVAAAFEALRSTVDPAARQALRDRIEAAELRAQAHAVPNELKQAWGRLGGRSFNATTSHERMNFYVDLPAEMLPRWAALELDRFTAPVFRAFATEVRTICEEKSRALDNAGRASKRELARALWGGHPYGRPVLGELEHLASPSVRAMEDFVGRWLVPENMAVVLAGDIEPDATLELLQSTLGRLPRGWEGGAPLRLRPEAPPVLSGEQERVVVHHGQGAVHIGWRTVSGDHPDALALRMAELLLSNGRTGRIDRELVQMRRIRGGGAWSSHRREGGSFVVWANPREGQSAAQARALLLGEVERLVAGELEPGVLEAVHRSFEVAELQRRETNRGRADWMTRAIVAGRSPAEARAREARIRALELDDIVSAARRWLGPDRVCVVRRSGEPSLPTIEGLPPAPRPIQTARNSAFFAEVMGIPVAPPQPRVLREGEHFHRAERGAWGAVVHNPNPYSHLAQVQWIWDRGQGQDRRLGTVARLVGLAGTPEHTRSELGLKLHQLGVRTGMQVRRDSTVLWLAGPADTLPAGAALVERRLVAPVLDRELRARELRDLLHRRRERRSTMKARVDAARGYVLYGDQSGFLARTPPPEELAGLLTAELGQWGEQLRGDARDCLSTGPVDPSIWSSFSNGADPRELPRSAPWQKGRRPAAGVFLLHHAGAQASVTVYRCAGPRVAGTEVAGAWLSTGLSGPAGLIFQELREARALAYSTGGGLSRGERLGDDDLLWGTASTEPPRAHEAAGLLVAMLQDGLPMLISDEARVESARVRLLQQLRSERVGFRSVPGAVRAWGLLGHEEDPREAWRGELARATGQTLQDAVEQLTLGPPLVVVVGDLERVDQGALAALGPVAELTARDVFGPDAAHAPGEPDPALAG